MLWIKSNGDRQYQKEHDLKYGSGPNAALLGNTGTNQSQHAPQQHGGSGYNNGNHFNNNANSFNNGGNQNGNQNGQNGNSNYNNGSNIAMNGQHNGSLRHSNNGDRNGNGMSAGLVQPKQQKRNSKDIKEWYV